MRRNKAPRVADLELIEADVGEPDYARSIVIQRVPFVPFAAWDGEGMKVAHLGDPTNGRGSIQDMSVGPGFVEVTYVVYTRDAPEVPPEAEPQAQP